mgnify:CR=1 FL=1
MKSKGMIYISLILMILILSSCAKSDANLTPCMTGGQVYGFWHGLFHGLIAPFGLLASLFDHTTYMYAPNNNGAWYALGFLFGSGGWGVLADRGTRKRKMD